MRNTWGNLGEAIKTDADSSKRPRNRAYLERFKEQAAKTDLIFIIGYGFRDSHINETISLALENGAKIYMFDIQSLRDHQSMPNPMKERLAGYCSMPLMKVFKVERQGITIFWDDLKRAYFDTSA